MDERSRGEGPWVAKLDLAETERLATYNAERARGIVHTAEYDEEMAKLQARFNRWGYVGG